MYSSEGVLCQLGGMTSHAAVVARGWGKPCITGCADMQASNRRNLKKPHLPTFALSSLFWNLISTPGIMPARCMPPCDAIAIVCGTNGCAELLLVFLQARRSTSTTGAR